MQASGSRAGRGFLFAIATLCAPAAGCFHASSVNVPQHPGIEPAPYIMARNGDTTYFADPRYEETLPRELQKVTMPEIVIEPPDILRIELVRVAPTAGYKIEAQDVLFLQLTHTGQTEPLLGEVLVGPDGQINLGPTYGGLLKVSGLTVEQAREAIEKSAKAANVKDPKVQLSLLQSRALGQIRGEYLVRPDGTIGLGTYGDVRVVGNTLGQAKVAIERHLARFLTAPEVAVDVAAYNSKLYYVIFDGGGRGQQIVRLPITGNDTVLDAVAQVFGLSPVSSEHHIWIARPSPAALNQELILPVDWASITRSGHTATNYQLLPGDRVFVKANPLVTTDNWISMILSPFERVFGVALLGQTSIQTLADPRLVGGAR